MAENQRNQKRWRLIYYLRVFDMESGVILGHLADVTTSGFMLLSDQALPVEKQYLLKMDVEDENSQELSIEFSAYSIWSKQDASSQHFYDTGFQLLNPSRAATALFQNLINELQFSE